MAGESYSVKIGVSASGVDKALSQLTALDELLNKVNGMSASISVAFQDNASDRLKDIEDAVNKVNGLSANASASLQDNATSQIKDVEDAVSGLNGSTALVSVSADDYATNQLADVQDQIASIDGSTATINIEANAGGGNGGGNGGNLFYDAFGDDAHYNSFMNGYKATKNAGSGFMGFADNFTSNALGYGSKAAALIGGVGLGRIFSEYSNWQYQQATTEGVLDPTDRSDENLARLAASSKQYTSKGYNPFQVSQAQTKLAQAGFNSGEIPDILPAMMNISNAGGLDLDTSTLITSSVLRSFSLGAEDATHVSDVLAKTANATASDIDGLGQSIKYSGAMANTLGIPLESLNAALGILSNYNIRGSQSGTTLRSAMSRLITPTKTAKSLMDEYNMSFIDGEGNMKDFADIIDVLNTGLGGLTSSEKSAAVKNIFGQTAVAGILSLMNAGGDQIRDLTNGLYNANGAAQEMADIKLDTLLGQWQQFKAEVSTTAIEIGEELSPMAIEFLDYLRGKLPDIKDKIISVAQYLSDHSSQVASFASGMAKLGVALMGISVAGKIVGAISGIGKFMSAISGISGLSGVAAAINPVSLAVIGLGGAFIYLYKHSSGFKFDFDNKFGETVQSINELKESLKGLSEIDLGPIGSIGAALGNVFGDTLITGLDTVKTTLDGLKETFDGLKEIWDQGFSLDSEAGDGRRNGLSNAFQGFWKLTHPWETSLANEGKKVKKWIDGGDGDAASQTESVTQDVTENVTKEITFEVKEEGTEEVKSKIDEIQNLYNNLTSNGTTNIDLGAEGASQDFQELIGLMQQLPQGMDLSTQVTGSDEAISQLQTVKDYADQLSNVEIAVNQTGGEEATAVTDGLTTSVESIPSSHDTYITCSGADTAAASAESVASAVNSIPTSKTVTISVSKVGSEDVSQNAMGSKFYNGGPTTLAENGYEIVDLGKGSQIFSHGDSKKILDDYYKNQSSLAKAAGAENYQLNRSSSNGNVTYLSFAIQGNDTKEIVNRVASELTAAFNSKAK